MQEFINPYTGESSQILDSAEAHQKGREAYPHPSGYLDPASNEFARGNKFKNRNDFDAGYKAASMEAKGALA